MNKMKFPKGKHYIDLDGNEFCNLCLKNISHTCGIEGLHFKRESCKKWKDRLFTKAGAYTKKATKIWQIVI